MIEVNQNRMNENKAWLIYLIHAMNLSMFNSRLWLAEVLFVYRVKTVRFST